MGGAIVLNRGDDDTAQAAGPEPTIAIDGSLQDDYIAFAQIFADLNDNGVWDEGEPITTTDVNGNFHLEGLTDRNVTLIAMGGVDTASGVPNNMVYRANASSATAQDGNDTVVSPMSTLIAAIAENLKSQNSSDSVTPELLTQAASILSVSLGLNLEDPSMLLNFDAVQAAGSDNANRTAQDVELLSINRQISVVVAATGALVNGADANNTNIGTVKSAKAFAELLVESQNNNATFSLKDASNIEQVVQKTMTLANESGVTQDLRASSASDLTLLSQVISNFNTKIDTATKSDDGPMSPDAIAAMVAVNDLMIPLLQNTGSEAISDRGGDISIAGSLQQFVANVTNTGTDTFVNTKIETQKTVTQADFGSQQDVAGYVGDYVPLGIQLPSLGLGDVVDTLTLDLSELAEQDAAVQLFRYDPLTKAYVEIPFDSNTAAVAIDPKYAGLLFVKTDGALADKDLFEGNVEIPLVATNAETNEEFQGQLTITIIARPQQVIATITEVRDYVAGPAGELPQLIAKSGLTNDPTPLIRGTLNQSLPSENDAQQYYAVEIYDGSSLLGTAEVSGTEWQFQTSHLAEGVHQFTARVTFKEPDGDLITLNWASQPYSITVDTIAPLAPTVDVSAGATVTGSAEAGSTVTIVRKVQDADDVVLGTAVAGTNGRWTFTPATRIVDSAEIAAFATDRAGNPGSQSDPVTVDWIAPTQLVSITGVTDDVAPVTGNVANGGFTNDSQVVVSGTISAALGQNESLKIYREGSDTPLEGTVTFNGTNWTFVTGTLADDEYRLFARVVLTTEAQTKLGAKSANYNFTVDTQVPEQTITVDMANDNVGLVQGEIANRLDDEFTAYAHTNDATPTFNGALTAPLASNELLVVYSTRMVNNVETKVKIGNAVVTTNDGQTTWVFTPNNALSDGDHTFTFQIEDTAGNVSAVANTAQYAFTIDTKTSDNVVITSDAMISVEENAEGVIYTASISGDRSVTWRLADNSDPEFIIDPETGAVSLIGPTDYESKTSYTFTVIAYDGSNSPTAKTVTVNITDFAETEDVLSVVPDTLMAVAAPATGETVELTFTVFRSKAGSAASVDWTLSGLPQSDIEQLLLAELPTEGTVTFADDALSATVTVNVPASLTQEALREAVLSLSNPSAGYAIDPDNGFAIIEVVDSNAALGSSARFTISATNNGVVQEGADGDITEITYTITRSGTEAAIGYEISPSGAALISGNDFCNEDGNTLESLPSGSLSFVDGVARVTLLVRGDNDVGPDELFNFVLTGLPEGSRVLGTAGGNIVNDDAYINVSAREVQDSLSGEVTHEFVISRSGNITGEHRVSYEIEAVGENATGQFNTNESVELVFAEGESEKVVSFTTTGSEVINGYQSFGIRLTAGDNVTLLNSTAMSTINPNVQDVSLQANIDRTLEGGAAEFSYTVIRSGDLTQAIDIPWFVMPDAERGVSANDFTDGVLPSGTIRFAAGESQAIITFNSTQDSSLEGDEGFQLVLDDSELPNYIRLINPSIEGVIVDDEAAVGFANNAQFQVVEGDNGIADLVITVSRVGFTGRESTVDWSLSFETGEGKAALADLMQSQGTNGTVMFRPGEATATITIKVAGDTSYEGGFNETFTVTLANPSEGTKLIDGTGASGVTYAGYDKTTTATIVNDDALISVAAPTFSQSEGNGGSRSYFEITVVRTGSTVGEDWVKWSLVSDGGTGTADNADLGQENDAIGVFDTYENSWIDFLHLNGNQSADGSITLNKSGYIMVAYNRDQSYGEDSIPFDQFMINQLGIEGGTITSMGSVVKKDGIAAPVSADTIDEGQVFDGGEGFELPDAAAGGNRIIITADKSLGDWYFTVSGLNQDGNEVTETIRGPRAGETVSTANFFTQVFEVIREPAKVAIGVLSADGWNDLDSTRLAGEDQQLPEESGTLANLGDWRYFGGEDVPFAAEGFSEGRVAIQSEADLSETTFVIQGGVSVGVFEKLGFGIFGEDSYRDITETGSDWNQVTLHTPAKIRAEQLLGSDSAYEDGVNTNYFIITGLDANGNLISERIAVQDFTSQDYEGDVWMETGAQGENLLSESLTGSGSRLVLASNGVNLNSVQFTITGMNALGQVISENVWGPDGSTMESGYYNNSSVVTNKSFATVTSVVANQDFDGNGSYLTIALTRPAETENLFSVVYGIAPCDADGEPIEGVMDGFGRIEFTAPMTIHLQGPNSGTALTEQVLNYVDYIDVIRPANDAEIKIGYDPQPGWGSHILTMADFANGGEDSVLDVSGTNYVLVMPMYGDWYESGRIQKNYGTAEMPNWQTLGYDATGFGNEEDFLKFAVTPDEIRAGLLRTVGDGVQIPAFLIESFESKVFQYAYWWQNASNEQHLQNFLIAADSPTSISGNVNFNTWFSDNWNDNTGNPKLNSDDQLAYAIFKIDLLSDEATLSFDIDQLGRYGLDTSRLSYAPSGTFSTDVYDMQEDGTKLLIPALKTQQIKTLLDLHFFTERGEYEVDQISSIQIDWVDDDNLYFNIGTSSEPNWVNFWDRESSYVSRQDILNGRLAYSGSVIELGAYLYDADESEIGYIEDVAGSMTILTVEQLSNGSGYEVGADEIRIRDVYEGDLFYNAGSPDEPIWIDYWDYVDDSNDGSEYFPIEDVLAGKFAFLGDYVSLRVRFYTDGEYEDSIYPQIYSSGADPVEPVNQVGSVALEGSGYIWVRYANVENADNEGADRAFINSLYVDGGATIEVVGQKVIKDGVVQEQTLGDAGYLNLNGSAVQTPLVSQNASGNLIAFVTPKNGSMMSDEFRLDVIGKDGSGRVFGEDFYGEDSYAAGEDVPRGGMSYTMELDGVDPNSIERIRYSENDYPEESALYDRTISFAVGDLKAFADYDYVREISGLTVLTLADIAERDNSNDSTAANLRGLYIYDFWNSALFFNEGTAEAPVWLNFWDYVNRVDSNYVSAEQIAAGKLAFSGSEMGLYGEVSYQIDGQQNSIWLNTTLWKTTIISLEDLLKGTELSAEEVTNLNIYHYSNVQFNAGTSEEPNWLPVNAWQWSQTFSAQDIVDGRLRYLGDQASFNTISFNDSSVYANNINLREGVFDSYHIGRMQFEIGASLTETAPRFNYSLANNPDITESESSTVIFESEAGKSIGNTRVTFQSAEDLSGRTFTVTGLDAEGNALVETVTGPNNGVVVTESRFAKVTLVEVNAGAAIEGLKVGNTLVFDSAQTVFVNSENSMPAGEVVVTGLDANGVPVTRTISGLEGGLVEGTQGTFSEIFSIGIVNAQGGTYDEYDEEINGGFIEFFTRSGDGFTAIELNGQRDEDGYIDLGGEQRITIRMEDGDDAEQQQFRVTGLNAEGETVVEMISGIGQNSTAVTVNYFTQLLSVDMGPTSYGNAGVDLSIGYVGAPIIPEQDMSRFGGEVMLGEPVAMFASASKITFSSTDDLRDREFTITGKLANGETVTEVVHGPNNGIAVSALAFVSITSIAVDEGTVGNVKVGYTTMKGGLTDNFEISGSGTPEDPFVGYSTNTLENDWRFNGDDAEERGYSEADVLLYVNFNGAPAGSVNLFYDLAVQGAPGADTLYVEYSSDLLALLQGKAYFGDGDSETTILIPVAGDDIREANEKMTLVLTGSSTGTTVVDDERSTEITIVNDDDVVWLSADAELGKEGNAEDGKVSFILNRLDAGPAKTVRWEVLLDDTTTAEENDFVSLTGEASFEEGETTATLEVLLARDNLLEADETFKVKLSTPQRGDGYQIIGNDVADGTIVNDDAGISIVAVNANAAEGDTGTVTRTYTITRTGDLSEAANLTWSLVGDTLDGAALAATGADFVGGLPTAQTITFAANAISTSQSTQTQTITIDSATDNFLSGDRGFELVFANVEGDTTDLTNGSIVDVIQEDDALSIIVTPPANRDESDEGNKAFTYTLTRNDADVSQPLTVNWKVLLEGEGALANLADFTDGEDRLNANDGLPSGTATFAAGSATTTITVLVKGDTVIEASEAFTLDIKPAYSDVSGVQYEAKIIGDDVGYNVIVDSSSVVEGNTDTMIKVHFVRAGDSTSEATLSYAIRGATGAELDAALAGDFTTDMTGEVVFAAGQEQVTLEFLIKGDSLYEANDGFVVDFKNGKAVLASSETVTIVNDDARVTLSVDKSSFEEGNPSGGFELLSYTLTREGNLDQASTMNWAVQASIGLTVNDFVDPIDALTTNGALPSGTVSFAAGETSKTFTLKVARDSSFEADETIRVVLSNSSAGTGFGGDGSVTTTVLNDDAQVYLEEITGENLSFYEADPASSTQLNASLTDFIEKTYTVKREGNLGITSTVQWIVEGVGDNPANNDFVGAVTGTLTFNATDTEKTFTVKIASDQYVEADETFRVRLHSPSEGTSIKEGTGESQTVTILNDDIGLRLDPASAVRVVKAEGQEGITEYTWTIQRIGFLDEAVTLNFTVDGNISGYGVGSAIYDSSLADYARDGSYWWTNQLPSANSADFQATSGSIAFDANVSTATLTIQVIGDTTVETSEAFKVRMERPSNAMDFKVNDILGNYQQYQYLEGIIVRDEASLGITSELDAATLSAAQAMVNAGYVAAGTDGEPNESLTLISATTAKAEGDTVDYVSHFFKVYREFSISGDVSVDWKVDGASYWMSDVYPYLSHDETSAASADDFVTPDALGTNNGYPSGRITIPDGAAYVILEVRSRADGVAEDLEGFKVSLSNVTPGNSINTHANYGYGFIGNDDALFSVGLVSPDTDVAAEMGSKVVDEAAGTVTYRIYRSGDLSHAAAVDWAVTFPEVVSGGVSTNSYLASAADFDTTNHPLSGTLNFEADQAYLEVTLKIADDLTTESWAEFYSIALSNARYTDGFTGKTIGVSSVAGTMESMIIDNEAPGSIVRVSSVVNNDGFEGTPGATTGTTITYTLTRSGSDTTSTGQIAWVLQVPAGWDYPDVSSITGDTGAYRYTEGYWSGLVTFGSGETVKTITVNVKDDQYLEQDENFVFTLVDAKSILENGSDDIKYSTWWYNYGADGSSGGSIDHGIFLGDTDRYASLASDGNVPDSGNMLRDPNAYQDTVVIKNDDVRIVVNNTLSGGSPALVIYEGNDGTKDVSFDLTRYGRIDNEVTLNYELIAGTATSGSDFVASTGTLTLAADTAVNGNDSKAYSFTLEDVITGDLAIENTETFTIRLSSPSTNVYFNQYHSSGGAASVDITAYIKTDDTTWWVDANNSEAGIQNTHSAVEAHSGNTPFIFYVNRTEDWTGDVNYNGPATVNWSLELGNGNGFASADDFVATSGAVSFATNEFVKAVTVYVKGDTLPEWTESFGFKIDSVSHGVVDSGNNLITAKILNDDTAISIDDVSVVEGDDGSTTMTYTIHRKGDLEKTSSVNYQITNGTASDSDVSGPRTGTVNFASGTNSSERYGEETTTISITVNGDTTPENHEILNVTLSGVSSGTTLLDASAVGTILNDEATFTLTAGEPVMEGNVTGQMFTVTRSHATAQEQVINWAVSSAGTGPRAATVDDFANGFPIGSVTFDANSSDLTKTFFVASKVDADSELDEIFKVTLTAGSGLVAEDITKDTVYGVILNDDTSTAYTGESDSTVSLAGPASVVEGNSGTQYVVFTVNRTFDDAPYDGLVSWSLSFVEGQTATADDFDTTSGTLLLPAGETSIELRIPVKGDSVLEANETFTVTIASQTPGMAIGAATAVGTITNDDSLIRVVDDVVVDENTGTATINLSRTGDLTVAKTVSWTLAASGNVAGTDDITTPMSGTATFAAGSESATVVIGIRDDVISEADEIFNFTLSSPSAGASLDSIHSSKTLTIANDDLDRIAYVVDAIAKPEGDGTGWTTYTITVSRENPTEQMAVNWAVEDTSPETLAGIEFEAADGQVVFEAGSLMAQMLVKVKSDDIGDFNKLFNLTLTPVDTTKAYVATDDAEIQVINDDPAFAVALSTERFVEGSGSNTKLVTFTITRSGDTTGTASIRWSVAADEGSGNHPVNLSDFGGYWPTGVVSFVDGESVKTIQVAIAPDSTFEADEGFKVVLSDLVASDPGARITTDEDTAVIANDDIGVTISVEQTSVVEDNEGDEIPVRFTIGAEGVPNKTVTVNFVLEGSGNSPADAQDFAFDYFDGDYDDSGFNEATNTGWVELRTNGSGYAEVGAWVNVLGDEIAGANESFRLRVTNVEGGTIAQGMADVTIENDDVAIASIVNSTVDVTEGNSGSKTFTFTLTRMGDISASATVDYVVEGFGDNPADVTDFGGSLPAGTATFEAGSAMATITISVAGDTDFESHEGFIVIVGKGTANEVRLAAEIRNDDSAMLEFRGLVTTVYEDAEGVLSYEIVRNGDNSLPLTVNYVIEGASASDFDPSLNLFAAGDNLIGTILIPAGESRVILNLPVAANATPGADREFTVAIGATGFASPAALASKVVDDDAGVSIELVGSTPLGESDTTYTFRVNRIGNELAATTLAWAIAGIGLNPASAADFVDSVVSGSIAFTGEDAAETSKTFTVTVSNDTLVENTEAFRVSLSYPEGEQNQTLPIRVASADVYIVDNDSATANSDVIHGGAGADVIDALAGNDIIHGGAGADLIYGGDGNDTIYGEGGADAIYGGAGDDRIVLSADNIAHFTAANEGDATTFVDGGLGIDTLALSLTGDQFDLGALLLDKAVKGVERIDLTGSGSNSVAIDVESLLTQDTNVFDTGIEGLYHQLMIDGDADDVVQIAGFGPDGDWVMSDNTLSYDDESYAVFTHDTAKVQLLINILMIEPQLVS